MNSDNSDEIESRMSIQQQVFRIQIQNQKSKIELNNKQNAVANNLKGTLFKRDK